MSIVVDAVTPSPVLIPRGGSVEVLVTAHQTSTPDDPGTLDVVFTPTGGSPQVLFTVAAIVDSPDDPPPPVPWEEIQLVPVGLAGVATFNNGGGSYTVDHVVA